MEVICSYSVGDGKSTTSVGWKDVDNPELTKQQLYVLSRKVITDLFTRELAEQGKHARLVTTDAKTSKCLCCVTMSASERLALKD